MHIAAFFKAAEPGTVLTTFSDGSPNTDGKEHQQEGEGASTRGMMTSELGKPQRSLSAFPPFP